MSTATYHRRSEAAAAAYEKLVQTNEGWAFRSLEQIMRQNHLSNLRALRQERMAAFSRSAECRQAHEQLKEDTT